MVTSTSRPKLWRVSFEIDHGDYVKADVVCFIQITGMGVRIYYSHHALYSRAIAAGPWNAPNLVRHRITPALQALIESSIMAEIWTAARNNAGNEILIVPGDPGRPLLEEIDDPAA